MPPSGTEEETSNYCFGKQLGYPVAGLCCKIGKATLTPILLDLLSKYMYWCLPVLKDVFNLSSNLYLFRHIPFVECNDSWNIDMADNQIAITAISTSED